MFFEKEDFVIIDGNKYEVSMAAKNDCWNCK